MAIYAIGHDIVENNRIRLLLEKYEQQFIDKVLSVSEKRILATKTDKVRYIAKRFAAKEAFSKACGTGMRDPILMPKISIYNDVFGKPSFIFDSKIISFLKTLGIGEYHLSISDEIQLSSAFVILEKA
ncbi:MAG: holo-ACP synthase [Burkholderiales bacterium]|jgi:holo-[acyl-carrier protein] synthase|nr:holo-ACP synthase [Burkholderiales bacterium]